MTATTLPRAQRLEALREERDWYAVAIANAVAAGRAPRDEDLAAYRAAHAALMAHQGISAGA